MTTTAPSPSSHRSGQRPILSAHGLTHHFGRGARARTVVDGVDLTVQSGSMTAIIGPSGSGKSTLLFCLSGLEKASSGSVDLLGIDPGRARAGTLSRLYRQQVGFVFQDYNLIPYLSARRNAALPGLLARRRDAIGMADEALASVGLAEHAGQMVSRMSGGQQQRTALARVLAQKGAVVFADEPTGALDSRSSQTVMRALRARADDGAAVVLVTHDLDAAALADQLVEMRDGRVQEVRR